MFILDERKNLGKYMLLVLLKKANRSIECWQMEL